MIVVLDQFEWRNDCWDSQPGCLGMIDLASYAQIAASRPGEPRGWHIAQYADVPPGLSDRGGVIISGGDPRESRPDESVRNTLTRLIGYRARGETLAEWITDVMTHGGDPAGLDRPFPLGPGRNRRIRVVIGSVILSNRRFVIGRDSLSRITIDHISRQLEILKQCSVSRVGGTAPDLYRKFADFTAEQLSGSTDPRKKNDVFAMIRPRSFDGGDMLVPHETTYTDAFNRASSTDLTNSSTIPWTEVTGDASIFSNARAGATVNGTDTHVRYDADLSGVDQYCKCDWVTNSSSTTRFSGPASLFASGADTFYTARQFGGTGSGNTTGNFQLAKCITGSYTNLGTGSTQTQVANKEIDCNSGVITIYSAASLVETINDTAIDGVTVGGLRGGFVCNGNAAAFVDNWEAGDLAGASGQPTMRRFGMFDGFRPLSIGTEGVRIL